MPVNDNVPEPLHSALEQMERLVQECKRSLSYAAPEMHDRFWIALQQELAEAMLKLSEGKEQSDE